MLNRDGIDYKTEGRLQDLEQSKIIDDMTLKELVLSRQSYSVVPTSNYESIMERVMKAIEWNNNESEEV